MKRIVMSSVLALFASAMLFATPASASYSSSSSPVQERSSIVLQAQSKDVTTVATTGFFYGSRKFFCDHRGWWC